jgi:raffinose/stachyose/melibiose transport system substrate-binding protein
MRLAASAKASTAPLFRYQKPIVPVRLLAVVAGTLVGFPTVADGKGKATGLLGGMTGFAISAKTKGRDASIALLHVLTDDTARDGYVKNGRVPTIKGAEISNPMIKKIADTITDATSFQNYWDQALSPELGQEQLDVSQALLGLSITPEAAAKRLDDVAKKSA